MEILARHFFPQIQAFFESEEGRKEYEEWKAEQAAIEGLMLDELSVMRAARKEESDAGGDS